MTSSTVATFPQVGMAAPLDLRWRPRLAMAVFVFVTIACVASGMAARLRVIYPAMATAVAVYLFFHWRLHYVAFTWWLWFLTPFVRRLVDHQSGWVDPSPILLAPLLATCVAGAALLTNTGTLAREGFPLAVCLGTIVYAAVVGLVHQNPPATVLLPLIGWLAPLFYGFFLITQWREYLQMRDTLKRTFLWGTLIMGAYGIFQFVVAPDWDRYWMGNVAVGSFGFPEPLQIRVFSTMNAPQSFAVTIMASLMLVMVDASVLQLPVAAVGYLSFLLTSSRGAWLGWAIGIVALFMTTPLRRSIRNFFLLIGTGIFVIAAFSFLPSSEMITQRLESFSSGRKDISYIARLEGYESLLADAAVHPFGKGLGVMDREHKTTGDDDRLGPHDSMYLELLLSLGWFGALLYLGSIALCLVVVIREKTFRQDIFVAVALAHTFALISQFPLESFALSVQGMSFWTFLSLVLAARRYYGSKNEQPVQPR